MLPSEDGLVCAIEEYRNKNNKDKLCNLFTSLVEEIIRSYSWFDVDDAIQEGVLICFEKVDKFDLAKGKAFNFFTTIIMCRLRQHRRKLKT